MPYWRYIGPESNPNSSWLTKGWQPPYGNNYKLAKDKLQLPNMPDSVTKVDVPWWQPVTGPRTATKHPEWGSGSGPEWYKNWKWPEK